MNRNERIRRVGTLLPDWFRANARPLPWRKDRDPYHVWLSEIMLQQTRAEAVTAYYERFLAALPTVDSLALVEDDKLMKLWEGLGYYSRARNLKKAAGLIVNDLGGVFPSTYEEIKKLPGVGPYTAGAIASICFDLPCPAVDGNVLRVFTRLTADDGCVDDPRVKKRVEDELRPLYKPGLCSVITQGLMELGACVCVPNGRPKCGVCPLNAVCEANRQEKQLSYPVRAEKRARRVEFRTVLLLLHDGKLALRKRKNSGLLAGLWEFPNTLVENEDAVKPTSAMEFTSALGAEPKELLRQTSYTHIFTHVEWHMTAFCVTCHSEPEDLVFCTPEEIERGHALPSAFRPFLEFAKEIPGLTKKENDHDPQ